MGMSKFIAQTVKVACKLANNQLTLTTTDTRANFDIQVSCAGDGWVDRQEP